MQQHRFRVRSTALVTMIAMVVIGLSIGVYCTLEYFYAQYYFDIQWRWYELSFPWNSLSFAFRFTEAESTLLIGMMTGVGGAIVWWSMSRLMYSLGVAISLLATFGISYGASQLAWSGTFPEFLLILACQTFILTTFFTLTPSRFLMNAVGARDPRISDGPRFNLRDLLVLTFFIGAFVMMVRPAMFNEWGHMNLWLPILGASTGLVTLLFLTCCHAKGLLLRAFLLAVCITSSVAFGKCLASWFPDLPILWRFYTGAYAVGTFRYFPHAYMFWFMLTGLVSLVTIAIVRRAEAFCLRARAEAKSERAV